MSGFDFKLKLLKIAPRIRGYLKLAASLLGFIKK